MGRYRLVGLLATGGMAEVYLALSGELSGFRTLVVVKRILPHLSSNTEFVDMFFDEARIAARLDHPNIARIIEVGHEGNEYFLAMEVVQGRSLSALLRRARRHQHSPLSHAQSAYIVAQAAKGLGYAHELTDAYGNPMNVVHRDVSPQNILVSFGGAVKVIDFGVARAYGRVTETVPGGLKGKIQYMSPEQIRAKAIDCRSDVYALGIVLWEALCGRRLYHRATEMETMQAIVDEPITPPSMIVPTSARLERIVMQALEKDPANRFQNGSEMALALERHAFASDGFNPLQISTSMKKLFATDYARWTRTVAQAMDLKGPPEKWGNTSGTYLNPGAIHLHSHDVDDRVTPREDQTALTKADEPRNDSHSVTTAVTAADDDVDHLDGLPSLRSPIRFPPPLLPVPTKRVIAASTRNLRVGAGVAVVCAAIAIGLSVFNLVRPGHTVTVIRTTAPAVRGTAPAATHEGAVPGTDEPAASGPIVAPESSPVVTEEAPQPAASAEAAPPPAASGHPGAAPSGLHVEPTIVAAAPPAPASEEKSDGKRGAGRKRGKKTTRGRAVHADKGAPVVAAPVAVATAPTPATAPAAVSAAAAAPAASPPADASPGTGCTLRLGTMPWTEVWIDGRNTNAHTPYSEPIACGKHEVTFKRDDLGLTKSTTITLRDGETVKRSFVFQEDAPE